MQKYGNYPSRDDFLVYLYNRDIVHGTHKTLPAQIVDFVETTLAENEPIMASLTPATFVQRWTASVTIPERKLLEAQA